MSKFYRHEQKYICSYAQIKHLFEILSAILPADKHQKGSYHVKSLYFDTKDNRFLRESLDGVTERSKYRLRRYDDEKKNIKFECKSSFLNLKRKRSVWLPQEEAEIIAQSKDIITFSDIPLINEFYCLKIYLIKELNLRKNLRFKY